MFALADERSAYRSSAGAGIPPNILFRLAAMNMTPPPESNAVLDAIATFDPPTQASVARFLGRHPQEVWRWVQEGRVPSTVARRLAKKSGVPAARLCPRVFGTPKRSSRGSSNDGMQGRGTGVVAPEAGG